MYLGPHHFQAQARYFEDSIHFAASSLWFAGYGLAACELDAEAIHNGTLALIRARGIMPDGLAFEMPDCDALPSPRPTHGRPGHKWFVRRVRVRSLGFPRRVHPVLATETDYTPEVPEPAGFAPGGGGLKPAVPNSEHFTCDSTLSVPAIVPFLKQYYSAKIAGR